MKLSKIRKSSSALALAVAFGATALLGITLGGGQAHSQDKFTIGFSVWDVSTTPATVPMIKGIREAAEAAGVKVIISDPKWDASAQVENLREFVVQGVDAVAVAPIDIAGILPAVRETLAAGIPVIGALGDIEGIPYVGVDDVEYGRLSARLMLEAMTGIEGTKRLVMFRGTPGGSPDRRRLQGMKEVFEAEGTDIEWVHVSADWIPDKALTGFQDVLQRFPKKGSITIVNAMGNCMIPPALDWAKRQGRDEILFVAIDLCKAEEEAIASGDMYGAVFQDMRKMGRLVINTLVAMRNAGDYTKLPIFAINPPMTFCTHANYVDCRGSGF